MTTAIAEQAIARAKYQSAHGPQFGVGECMERVHDLYDAPAIGDYDRNGRASALDGWEYSKHRHPFDGNYNAVPRGVPFWWSGGSHGDGHVAPTEGGGLCMSTDILRDGYFDEVPLARIAQQWELHPLGWTEDINGVRVYDQEEDMTPDDLLNAEITGADRRTFKNTLAVIYNRNARIEAALSALAEGLAPDVRAAVKAALADGVVDVNVTVHDKTGA